MKVVIELNDETLHNAIEAQIGKQISQYTESVIQARVNEIVDKKLERVSESDLQQAMERVCKAEVDEHLRTNDYARKMKISALLGEVALTAIRTK